MKYIKSSIKSLLRLFSICFSKMLAFKVSNKVYLKNNPTSYKQLKVNNTLFKTNLTSDNVDR